ncbi:MAG: hypothetical protein WC250_01290 [Candidatus Paceibacterota bacterium]|jgi:hypothetical protein
MKNATIWKIVLTLGTLLVVGFLVFWYQENRGNESYAVRADSMVGLSFRYRVSPNGYILREHSADNLADPSFIKIFSLMPASDYESFAGNREASEGPASIEISVFKNLKNETAGEWAENNPSLSNLGLLSGVVNRDYVLAGEKAVRYLIDGLYRTDTVAVAYNKNIYLFSGAFLDENSLTRKDFEPLLDSIKFLATEETGGAAGSGGSGILPFKSGVKGQVLLGPTCPVMRIPPDPNCADRPYQTTVQVITIGSPKSSPFATAETDKDGRYEIKLPPGEYGLQPVGGRMLPRCETRNVTVGPDEMAEVNLACDTGIR